MAFVEATIKAVELLGPWYGAEEDRYLSACVLSDELVAIWILVAHNDWDYLTSL
jgi:hypothetical protein